MKFNNTILALIFFSLLGLFVAKKTFLKPSTSSFKQSLTSFDANDVDKITIQLEGMQITTLTRTGENWEASNGQLTVPAQSQVITTLIDEMSNIKTKQLVSKSKDKWMDYEVDDTKAKKINLFSAGKKIAGLHIGRFNFNQQTRAGVSYVRNSEESDIYAIDGFISMSAAKDFNSFRNAKMVETNLTKVDNIKLNSSGINKSIAKSLDGTWLLNEQVIDSSLVARYISGLERLNGSQFNDAFSSSGKEPSHSLSAGELKIDVYRDDSNSFVVKSNQNSAFFSSDSVGIFKNLILDFPNLN